MTRFSFFCRTQLRRWYAVPVFLGGLLLLVLFAFSHTAPDTQATWVWDATRIETETEEMIAFAKQNEINLIYLHIEPVDVSFRAYRTFIRQANAAGIRVEALGGDPYWSYTKNREKIGYLIDWVKAFNNQAAESERFRGIHVDIEPYVLPDWQTDQESIVRQWLENLEYLVVETKKDTNLSVSADLPFWIDELNVPGKAQTVSSWMLERLDSITLMAYRNQTQGINGIMDIVQNIVDEAEALQAGSVIVGVNIRDSQEGMHVSFHAHGTAEMKNQLAILRKEMANKRSFAGTAVHDFESWAQIHQREENM